MLICPQCQFENPDSNKFCQQCGTSLTQKVCPKCGTNVALSEIQCQDCGAKTGTVWLAIICTSSSLPMLADSEQNRAQMLDPTFQLPQGAYLDQEQRYKLLEPLPAEHSTTQVQVRVLDCKPFQLSPLEADTDQVTAIPAIAKTYLALQSEFYQICPTIHDAWQQGEFQLVLIEDRSDWPQLIDLWQNDQTTPLEILHWFDTMAQLWAALEPWHCRQSLLELSNLRVDEDQLLRLQRLYVEPEAEKSLTLQDLGRVWQRLFQESQRTQFGSLVRLHNELQIGSIQSIDDLRSCLKAIAAELSADVTSSPVTTPLMDSTTPTALQPTEPQESPTQSDDTPTNVLPMQLVSLEDAGRTDVGRQRHHNEDYFGIETDIKKLEFPTGIAVSGRGLYILCDGMGGHAGGEVASTMAVKTLQQYFQAHWQQGQLPDEDSISSAVRLANKAIYDVNQQDARSGVGRMGTTLVMVLLQDTQVAVAHVGDSRLYRLTRQRGLEQVTLDHEVGQREILRGVEPEIAYARPDAYQLTQALGPRDGNFIIPEVQFLELNEDTLLVLASDGLSDNDLLEYHWQAHLEPLLDSGTNLEVGVSDLIDLANDYNGHDNITAIAIRVTVRPSLEQ